MAADDPRRLQQPLVGLAHRLARESEHADGLAFRRHGEGQHAAHAGAFGHGLRRRADVAPQVARPGRTELPHHARALQEAVHGRLVDAPAVLETQRAARLVQTVIPAGIPAFRFAHHAHRGLQAALRVFRRRKRARYLVLQREHLLGPLLCAHVAADAVIAEKAAVGTEHRLAADAEVAHAPLGRRAPHERVVEGPAGVKQRAMRVPPALDFEAALPAAHADQAPLQILVAARDVAAFEAGKAVAGVGFPVPVRGQVGEATRARGALAVCLLRRRLLHEPADAAAEGVQPVRQALVGRTHRAAAEAEHADDFRARAQRDQQRGAQTHLLEQLVAYALGPGLLQIVADPQRFSRLPHGAHHPLAPLDSALARSFDHGRDALGVQRAPMLVKAQRAAGFFHLPQLGAIPALAFADRAQRTLEREGDAASAGEAGHHRVLEQEQLLGALLRGDIAPGAKVAAERAACIEDRLAAERQPDRAAVVGGHLELEIPERLAPLELAAVPVPILRGEVQRPLIAALVTEIGRQVERQIEGCFLAGAARQVREPQLVVLLPVPVGARHVDTAARPVIRGRHIQGLDPLFLVSALSRAAGPHARPYAPLLQFTVALSGSPVGFERVLADCELTP